mmetsp:Transcript_10856/g.23668  ORF Transcript_10856/g.23668 Transcript_10856/m.23668 type:complete len:84 (-) Transcript_10856:133-384(-)
MKRRMKRRAVSCFIFYYICSSLLAFLYCATKHHPFKNLKVGLLVYQWPGEGMQRQGRMSCCKWAGTAFFLLGQITVMKGLLLQ